jgi:uncharacterized membrane protein
MEFFKILEEGLIDFPAHELQEILYDYKEHFSKHNLMEKQKKK